MPRACTWSPLTLTQTLALPLPLPLTLTPTPTPWQYSVTDQFKSAHDPSKGFVLPGVFFIYDISPIKVKF